MAAGTAAKTTTTDQLAQRSAAAARRETAAAPSEDADEGEPSAAEAGSDMLQAISRMIYSGSYAIAYGVVYAAVFVAQSLPRENAVMHGFQDGGRAAMDELGGS
jgi:hypothetical protein